MLILSLAAAPQPASKARTTRDLSQSKIYGSAQQEENTTPKEKAPFGLLFCVGQLYQQPLGGIQRFLLQLLHYLSQPILIAEKINVEVALCLQDRVLQRTALDLQVTQEVCQLLVECVLHSSQLVHHFSGLLGGRTQIHLNAQKGFLPTLGTSHPTRNKLPA